MRDRMPVPIIAGSAFLADDGEDNREKIGRI
jgi:hypothetical protein